MQKNTVSEPLLLRADPDQMGPGSAPVKKAVTPGGFGFRRKRAASAPEANFFHFELLKFFIINANLFWILFVFINRTDFMLITRAWLFIFAFLKDPAAAALKRREGWGRSVVEQSLFSLAPAPNFFVGSVFGKKYWFRLHPENLGSDRLRLRKTAFKFVLTVIQILIKTFEKSKL